ncbi:MAG: hypothetical protein H0Z24_08905 [Thermosipho sp. (in: Bacteria)]|nr:hypothetical protein [Thermosipho sp. (in: thermotogales)]
MAFAKGLTAVPSLPEEVKRGKGKFEIGEGVVATGDEYLLFKHLIIQKAKRPLDKKEVDDYMLYLIEEGLKIMEREIDSLSELDNYLIYLVNSPGEQNP